MVLLASTGEGITAPWIVISASAVIILSYFANLIAKRTNIPSVLLLILLGILAKQGLDMLGIPWLAAKEEGMVLELLGTVGLIFIVLEAALDLKLTRDKWPIIWKSLLTALIALGLSSLALAWILNEFVVHDPSSAGWIKSFTYAIPLSIMSSAIIIPSVSNLSESPKEFMIYESTFSDILGIMVFYLLLANAGTGDTGEVTQSIFTTIGLTLVLSIVFGYGLSWLVQRITGNLKLFLTIACLILIYQVGKLFHLPSLILILVFGLILSNSEVFWRGRIRNAIDHEKLAKDTHNFHVLTLETAFVVRTFFFVIFGVTIVLSSLYNISVIFYSLMMVVALYVVRLLVLLVFNRKELFPLLYIAPRGLITILLYFQIGGNYPDQVVPEFNQGILLFVIITTSIVMTISLIQNGYLERKLLRFEEENAINTEEFPEAAHPSEEHSAGANDGSEDTPAEDSGEDIA